MTVYYKAAVNSEGQLMTLPAHPQGFPSLGACEFTFEEAQNLEAMDCRPVVVQVIRALRTRQDVVDTGAPV